ncbi:MAG: DNA polymerase I [Firmicutes bacterium]|nr:DNA polymerase I [Bacillota bacterium]
MKKIILVDGNNLLFRSYYATAYNGNVMKNSKGFPTNALYGLVTMINKIITEEQPEYIAVAFDIGVNFRREKYDFYKDGRAKTPEELKMQMPYSRKILNAMGIKTLELEPYEADDIIGTLASAVEKDKDFIATIVSSDKDLLQLLSDQVDIKLLKQKDYIRYNPKSFFEDYKIKPINMIDLKALAGDSSDNIPGVKGIGEKTAINLLSKYETIENLYEHIDEVKGKTKEKLEIDKESAFMSKEIATIYREVPIDTTLENYKYEKKETNELYEIFEELEFYSFLKNFKETKKEVSADYIDIEKIDDIKLDNEISFYIELDKLNYHDGEILGMSVSSKENNYFIKKELIKEVIPLFKDKILYTFDNKKNIVALNKIGINIPSINYDLLVAASLLDIEFKDDISYLLNNEGIPVRFYSEIKDFEVSEELKKEIVLKSRFILDSRDEFITKLKSEEEYELFKNIEMPLIDVLADMEITGVNVDKKILEEMKEETKNKIDKLTSEIYELAGCEFNISSPKQLGEVLFDKLKLPGGKKGTKSYKTDVKVLHKLMDKHPIIERILIYRNLSKIYSTYLEGLMAYIKDDSKVHTIFKQNFTRTGRLSSIEPNLQNIPARDEEGRKIRKAFYPENDLILSVDYSQIELRLLAHISKSKDLIDAFVNGEDIHTKVAADINGVSKEEVTKSMRSAAKAVIFGIVYGISGFGLGESLEIRAVEAKKFIDKYYELYPGVKKYMDDIVKFAYENGYVRTLFNRKRVIDELSSSNYMVRQTGERIALNTPIQGTSADIIKKAMVEVYKKFKDNNIKTKMIIQVHDELIFDVVKEEKELVESIVKDTMENVIKLSVPLKVSTDYGINWYDAK